PHARLQVDRDAAAEGKNTSRDRWKRAAFLAGRLQDGNDVVGQEGDNVVHSEAARKHLETQHWLELIDGKHRYGSNCLNYLVTIDSDGKLRWARNGQHVDTTAGRWKDAGGGKGIVPFDDPTPGTSTLATRHSFAPSSSSSPASSTSSLSGEDEDAAMHYVGLQKESKNPVKRVLQKNFTIRGLLDRLLRKTIKRNTWIYVSDKNFNIFIGIKGRSYTDCQVAIMSAQHFRMFISVLEERGVDMSKVEISKAELALWGYVLSIFLDIALECSHYRVPASNTSKRSRRSRAKWSRKPKRRLQLRQSGSLVHSPTAKGTKIPHGNERSLKGGSLDDGRMTTGRRRRGTMLLGSQGRRGMRRPVHPRQRSRRRDRTASRRRMATTRKTSNRRRPAGKIAQQAEGL
ncbi:hypothetical protein K466DRAFT_479925, partial [Polyporus arcularius HHB13444]